MPVKVIKYTCAFRCGKKAMQSYKDMTGHEESCWKNPVNQTCNTCSNQIYEKDEHGIMRRGCKIEELSDALEKCHEVMASQNTTHVRPVYNCHFWNKESTEYAIPFGKILESEISGREEGTKHYPFYNKPVKELPQDDDSVPS